MVDFGAFRSTSAGPHGVAASALHRKNRMETLCRLRLRAAALGAPLPPPLQASWRDFVQWFELDTRRNKGDGIAQYWLQQIVQRLDENLKAKPTAFVKWVQQEMSRMPRPATTARV